MSDQSNQLLRVLGLAFGLAAVIGSVIGQGILRSPGEVAAATGSPELIIALWVAGGVATIIVAFPIAELAAAIPRAGGFIAYVHRAFGGKASLLVAYANLLNSYGSMAFLCYVIGEFLVRLNVGGGELTAWQMGIASMLVFAAINATGTRIAGNSQIFLSALKGAVFVVLVVLLFAAPGAPAPAQPPEVLRSGWLPLGTALVVILNTYAGWNNVVCYGEEISDPGKQLPRVLFMGVAGVTVLYVAVNVAMLHVMTPDQMAGSNFVAADAVGIVFGPRAEFALTVFGVFSIAALTNLLLMTGTRITFASARAHLLPPIFTRVSRNGTPLFAMLLMVVAAALFILTDSYLALVSLTASLDMAIAIAGTLALVAIRRWDSELERPYRMPFYPLLMPVAIFVQAALLVVFVVQDPFYSLAGFVLLGAIWLAFQAQAWARGHRGIAGAKIEDLQ